jgi:RNA polymerase sigma factor (sigma-70 family)
LIGKFLARTLAREEGIGMVRLSESGGSGGIKAQLEPMRLPLMRFFLRRVGNPSEAEDLTQETFARLLSAAERERFDDPKAFVFRIALNLLSDRARKTKRRAGAALALVDPHRVDELSLQFVEDRTPERVLQGKDDVDRLVKALGELNERTRDIYLLFRLENMKQAKIAELFGISRSTVEKEVMRATHHLAKRIGRSGD